MVLIKDPIQKRILVSYLVDWALVVIMTAVFFAIDKIPPYHRAFSVQDKTIMFPYTENEAVPIWSLGLICVLGPIVVMAIISLAGLGYKRKSFHDFHSGVLGLCLGLSMTVMLTDVIKITAGRARPDMLSRCQPPADTVDPLFGLSTVAVCTTDITSKIMIDGFKSFPSGHSSFSFAGLGYLAFYIAGKMKMFDERGHTYKGFMFAFPIIGALLIAISRTRDYRHHWQDVTIGAILGTLCAYFAYRQFYPGLSHNSCHDPFLARLARLKRFDEELAQHLHHPSTAAYDQSSLLHSESTSSRTKYQMEDDMTLHNDIPLAPK